MLSLFACLSSQNRQQIIIILMTRYARNGVGWLHDFHCHAQLLVWNPASATYKVDNFYSLSFRTSFIHSLYHLCKNLSVLISCLFHYQAGKQLFAMLTILSFCLMVRSYFTWGWIFQTHPRPLFQSIACFLSSLQIFFLRLNSGHFQQADSIRQKIFVP